MLIIQKNLFKFHRDLPFLAKRKELINAHKYISFLHEKLLCDINVKEKYIVHIRALKQALKHGLVLKKYTE